MQSTGNNPNWKAAPPWANFWAVDADNKAYWHETRPDRLLIAWSAPANTWNRKEFDQVIVVTDWTQTLQEFTLPTPPRLILAIRL